MSEYWTMSLSNGANILAEVISCQDDNYTIKHPITLEELHTKDGSSFLARPFLMYGNFDSEREIRRSDVVLFDSIAADQLKYYGEALVQIKITQVKTETYRKLSGNISNDYMMLFDAIQQIKDIGQMYNDKFGVAPPDTSDFERMLAKHKPAIH